MLFILLDGALGSIHGQTVKEQGLNDPLLVSSEQECLRRTASCRNSSYSNQFFIKNNGDHVQEAQVQIRTLNNNDQEMKVIDSKIMTLQPGELRLLETEETNDNSSIWNQYSFQTAYRIANFQYKLRHR